MKKLSDKLYVTAQITESDFDTIAKSGVRTIINNRPDDEEPGQLSADRAAQLAADHGIDYVYLPMVNGRPLPENLVSDFKNAIEASDGVVLAHCRSGMRSSVLWALAEIEDQNLTVDSAITTVEAAGIPLGKARALLEIAASQ